VPETDERDEPIREQLERILASPVFRNSKRYAAVLRYIVERTLEGSGEQLKERTIGVDVFAREPDYDTASDHVVRSAMAEVRKRLAQYYQEEAHTGELRFDVQPGSYVPVFRLAAPGVAEPDVPAAAPDRPKTLRRFWPILGIAASFGTVCLALAGIGAPHDSLTSFWGPVLKSPGPVLLCIGNLEGGEGPGANPPHADPRALTMSQFHRLPSETVHFADAVAVARFAGFLGSQNKSWSVATQSAAGLRDLGTGPAVLIGLMNNDWTERLVGELRFRVERTAPHKVTIRDNRNPSMSDWAMDYTTPLLSVTKDYALVLRVLDPKTDQMVVAAAGISVFGTEAAAELLTSEHDLRSLEAALPGGWRRKNLELVLSTEVIRAQASRPKILAVHAW